MKNIKYIIIPDIHGRTFWKETIEKYIDTEVVFIFLGDYLDPYKNENLPDDGYNGLLEIIEYKKQYPDRFVLLLGNHDLHYFTKIELSSRWDCHNSERNKKIFMDNIELFQLVYAVEINNKKFLFSHAGVLKDWIYDNSGTFHLGFMCKSSQYKPNGLSELPDFNGMFRNTEIRNKLCEALDNVSYFRGGMQLYGSCIWADVREFLNEEQRIPGVIQVFGHTQQDENPVNYSNVIYCLDCRRAFGLTDEGNIIELSDYKEIPSIDAAEEYKKIQSYLAKYGWNLF